MLQQIPNINIGTFRQHLLPNTFHHSITAELPNLQSCVITAFGIALRCNYTANDSSPASHLRTMEASPLSKLPAELRVLIYELALVSPDPINIYIADSIPENLNKEGPAHTTMFGATLTCKAMRNETIDILYGKNVFSPVFSLRVCAKFDLLYGYPGGGRLDMRVDERCVSKRLARFDQRLEYLGENASQLRHVHFYLGSLTTFADHWTPCAIMMNRLIKRFGDVYRNPNTKVALRFDLIWTTQLLIDTELALPGTEDPDDACESTEPKDYVLELAVMPGDAEGTRGAIKKALEQQRAVLLDETKGEVLDDGPNRFSILEQTMEELMKLIDGAT
ncbi:hypothetical protein LTR17_021162 [Elasticomyces elasticus]|nr:hypothetical protein LTR17_021162 [Elasticomyces elasticus]